MKHFRTCFVSVPCSVVKLSWDNVLNWWNWLKRSDNVNLYPSAILSLGYKPESNRYCTLNHHLLIAKYYIYLAKISLRFLKWTPSCSIGKKNSVRKKNCKSGPPFVFVMPELLFWYSFFSVPSSDF